mgnify:CR=1 FL=1|jgi:hypothetical protein
MSDYDDSNTIVLFKNDKWEPESKHPVYKGTVKMDGKQKNVSVWIREAKGDGKMEKGTKFFSGTLDTWEGQAESGEQQGRKFVAESDIPF